ncbi:hypothetical protein [Dendronalium sp. ChiSLP03b]|nr:hypothetical protein [Dendronalium sp. ChiSLP03b]
MADVFPTGSLELITNGYAIASTNNEAKFTRSFNSSKVTPNW